MTRSSLVSPDDIRTRFSRAMSDMYRQEVPQYGTLLDLVADINADVLAGSPELRDSLARSASLERLNLERHGAIRLGTAAELATMRRVFAVMGMEPVGYYDLSVAGIPVHSTAFRPVGDAALAANPFRVFTSLLRLELLEDQALAAQAREILERRNIFTARALALTEQFERDGGLDSAQADEFVEQVRETFRWHSEATVTAETYQALHDAHRLIADVVCFAGPHINHLTPRTLDIDALQAAMPGRGIPAKEVVEGPPRRKHPILLRQTSFKALEEPVRFLGADTAGTHTARFGEVEQRGIALTRKGRQRYDALLARARAGARPALRRPAGRGLHRIPRRPGRAARRRPGLLPLRADRRRPAPRRSVGRQPGHRCAAGPRPGASRSDHLRGLPARERGRHLPLEPGQRRAAQLLGQRSARGL